MTWRAAVETGGGEVHQGDGRGRRPTRAEHAGREAAREPAEACAERTGAGLCTCCTQSAGQRVVLYRLCRSAMLGSDVGRYEPSLGREVCTRLLMKPADEMIIFLGRSHFILFTDFQV